MNKDNYEDIIDLPHYEPLRRPCMSIQARAAQFAFFAALTGYVRLFPLFLAERSIKDEVDIG